MTTDAGVQQPGGPLVRIGLRRFDRFFNRILAGFGVLYAVQTLDSFVADLPSMSNPLGDLVIVLVVLSVLSGLGALAVPTRARIALLSGAGLFGVALVVWPFAVEPPIPTDPMPWLVAIWPVPAAYAAQACRTRVVPVVGAVAMSLLAGFLLWSVEAMHAADVVINLLFMLGTALALVLLLGRVRNGVVRAAEAQEAALARFTAARIDDVTEEERKRTDALMHDAVLMTFLAVAAARTPEEEDLARRMAANSLRVLMHVNGVGREGVPVVPFGQVFTEAGAELTPLLAGIVTDLGAIDSIMLPEDVARAVMAATLEVVRNSVQHAHGATRRTVRADALGPDGIRVTVEDDGCGFDPPAVRLTGGGRGLAAAGRLRELDGRVDVRSTPGEGTSIAMSWGSVVMAGTDLLTDEQLAVSR